MVDAGDFRRILSHYPTGVSAITALSGDEPCGMIVGTFNSVSLDPPLVGFFPDRNSGSWDCIRDSGHFFVNILGSDQGDLCAQLALSGPEKFAGIDYKLSPLGSPMLNGIIAGIDCELYRVSDAGDHELALGRVASMELYRDADPLLFLKGHYGGFRPPRSDD